MHLRRGRQSLLAGLAVLALFRRGRAAAVATPTPPRPDQAQAPSAPAVALPNKDGSFKFAVLGDFGANSKQQYELAEQMAKLHDNLRVTHVVLVGDNLYGSERPQDFLKKFEQPYKPLLDAGVKFYASLGNHDAREQRFYKLFNMDGSCYYTFSPKPNVRFFALESTYPVPEQIEWLENELKASSSDWKIVVLPSPAVFVGRDRTARTFACAKCSSRCSQVQRQRRVHRARPFLRARQAAEGHRVLRGRLRRPAAQGQHRPHDPASPQRGSIPTRRSWPLKSTATRCTSTPSREPGRPWTPASSLVASNAKSRLGL